MKVLDLFSGIGGFSLGLERAGMETVAFCEIEEYPRKVLAKHWPDVPIYDDVRTLTGDRLRADGIAVDVICGGYPCQPFSTAGKRGGDKDDRHLWPEYLRLIQEIRPSWIIGENVAGHISMGLDRVLSDLENEDYAWEPFVIPACAVDAKHRRDRLWIVANTLKHGGRPNAGARPRTEEEPEELQRKNGQALSNDSAPLRGTLANTLSNRSQGKREDGRAEGSDGLRGRVWRHEIEGIRTTLGEWPTEPRVGRVADGVPDRVDRLKCLGNAVVPQVVEIIGRAIMAEESYQANSEVLLDMNCGPER